MADERETQPTDPSAGPTTARAREAQQSEASRSAAAQGGMPAGGARRLGGGSAKRKKKQADEQKSGADSVLELVVILAVALGLALGIQAFLVKPYSIPSESMEPTLNVGQRILVDRIGNRFTDPSIGDVLVFHPPASATGDNTTGGRGIDGLCGATPKEDQACTQAVSKRSKDNFVKRVVAGPGDTIAVVDDHVVLNGKRQTESFIKTECGGSPANFPVPLTVPKDHYFMMGDNRQCSQDSRFWGPIPRDWIIGGAFATYWPPKRIGLL